MNIYQVSIIYSLDGIYRAASFIIIDRYNENAEAIQKTALNQLREGFIVIEYSISLFDDATLKRLGAAIKQKGLL